MKAKVNQRVPGEKKKEEQEECKEAAAN